ncbi:cytochrome d ubiquinol oxidase subunit II, partial [Bacillus sp. LL01]|uniref:cytochrome d ubiquinol oxidase subunit II n=1 Tax=Bacillus sp. LL01 TaxID=1665556 RepID=UPI000AB35B94
VFDAAHALGESIPLATYKYDGYKQKSNEPEVKLKQVVLLTDSNKEDGYALFWSFPTIMASILVFFALNEHNPTHFENMVDLAWMFSLSFLFFLGAVYYIWKEKNLGLSFIFVMLQFATAFYGYGASHLPYLLYPHLTIYDGFTNEAMAIALIIAFIAGLFLLIPSLYLLMRLFLFDNKYVQGKK